MIEDDIYRTSSQYRLWSFTSENLTSLRASTNSLASDRVREAITRSRDQKRPSKNGDGKDTARPNGAAVEESGMPMSEEQKNIDCLTVAEEGKLLRYYCEATMKTAEAYSPRRLPTNVWVWSPSIKHTSDLVHCVLTILQATAIQFLRRFYLTNSPMTYHPKEIMPCALFLATKTENHYTGLKDFATQLDKTTPEDILAAEFLLTQGLRFTFDVRHPFRGLDGGIMELSAVAEGEGLPVTPMQPLSAKELKAGIEKLEGKGASTKSRIGEAHNAARELLKGAAQMTDAYFLYTPSQIWLASLLLADEPLARFYLGVKIPSSLSDPGVTSLRVKVLATITACAELLKSYVPSDGGATKELKKIAKKLYQCQNPEKMDLKELNKAQKREVEREKLERDGDVFGGELGR